MIGIQDEPSLKTAYTHAGSKFEGSQKYLNHAIAILLRETIPTVSTFRLRILED